MKLPYRAMVAVKEALRQQRQLTMAEQLQAGEILTVLRARAVLHFGLKAPDKRPRTKDETINGVLVPKDTPEVARLKMRGLFEIVKHASEVPDSETDFIVALVDEAARDFAADAAKHRKGVPPQVAAAALARANMSDREKVEERLRKLEAASASLDSGAGESAQNFVTNTIATDERLDALENRLATLETGAALVAERLDALDNSVQALENAQTAPDTAATEKEGPK